MNKEEQYRVSFYFLSIMVAIIAGGLVCVGIMLIILIKTPISIILGILSILVALGSIVLRCIEGYKVYK